MARYQPVILSGLLLLISFAVLLRGGEAEEKQPVSPGALLVSLQESKSLDLDIVSGRAPLTRSWAELLHQAHMNGWTGSLNGSISGLRTYRDQLRLYRDFLRGKGAPAFHPEGPSRHLIKNVRRQGQWYQAVDVSKPQQLIRAARRIGVDLYQPYGDEPWHIEAQTPFIIFRPGREPGPPRKVAGPVIMPIVPVVVALLFVSIGLAVRDWRGPLLPPLGVFAAAFLAGLVSVIVFGPILALLTQAIGALLLASTWPAGIHRRRPPGRPPVQFSSTK